MSSEGLGEGKDTTMKEMQQKFATSGDDSAEAFSETETIEDGEQEVEEIDYGAYTKEGLVKTAEALTKEDDVVKADGVIKEIKPFIDEMEASAKAEALQKFKEEGGEEADFDYKHDELYNRFLDAYKTIKNRKSEKISKQVADKEKNLEAKQQIIEELRQLVDSEETNTSINTLKEIQQKWKSIGNVPPQYAKNLWANYNALVQRFYDKRSIYEELKELDRKKNLEAKKELCERAEKLDPENNIHEAIKQLDELHEEFKHIGPVPRDEQEALWQRFKAASDKIHHKKREHNDKVKAELQKNLEAKLQLIEKVKPFAEFQSDSLKEWNEKTRELLQIQDEWKAIGGLPRKRAKEVNKAFWSVFKTFFAQKNQFFKKLDEQREENLKKKEALVERAEALKDSTDWVNTAEELKKLQKEWKDIGPVPEKARDKIFDRFKTACDAFFERKRAQNNETEKSYEENLAVKEQICAEIEQMAKNGSEDVDTLVELNNKFAATGFVPKKSIKSIQSRFDEAVEQFLKSSKELDEHDKENVRFKLKMHQIKGSPNASKKLAQKENNIRKQISKLEENITNWQNNLEFFRNSRQAEQFKDEFNQKIEKANQELEELKDKLYIIKEVN